MNHWRIAGIMANRFHRLRRPMITGTLHYIHDPMCSWCWAFRPALDALIHQLPDTLAVRRVLGGLAPDSDQPMPDSMQRMLQATWQRIESHVPGTVFNHDFWRENQPRRSTWPACRAVLAAREQRAELELPMIAAIQQAYYLQARNPSDTQTLTDLAGQIGCDTVRFSQDLHSDALHRLHGEERALASQLGVQGYPSLVMSTASCPAHHISIDYRDPARMLADIKAAAST